MCRSPATGSSTKNRQQGRCYPRHRLDHLNRGRTISIQDITLGTVDLAIVAVYFMVVFAIGFRMARRTRSAEDLFLAGRRLGWLPIGLAGAAYTWGIAVANYEWMAAPILVVLALFLVPLTVWDPPSSGPSAFRFPGYVPSTEGDIS